MKLVPSHTEWQSNLKTMRKLSILVYGRIVLQLFKNKKKQFEQSSWSSQSSQSGGHVIAPTLNTINSASNSSTAQAVQHMYSAPIETQNRFDTPGFETEVFN